MSIPKIIHYCWISGDPYPEEVIKCIESWESKMPDYKLILWDKDRCKSLNIPFVNDAITNKKYAFAADIVRVAALYKEGGIYLDTDVIIYKNLEPLLKGNYVSFMEVWNSVLKRKKIKDKYGHTIGVKGMGLQAAVMAAEKGHPFLASLLKYYSNLSYNEKTIKFLSGNLAPFIQARVLLDWGFIFKDTTHYLKDNIIIYHSKLITNGYNLTSEAFGSHLCLGGWKSEKDRLKERKIYIIKRGAYLILKRLRLI